MGLHSICVFPGSAGNAQKKPMFCIVSNSFLLVPATFMQDTPSFVRLQISACWAVSSEENSYVAPGCSLTKSRMVCLLLSASLGLGDGLGADEDEPNQDDIGTTFLATAVQCR